MTPDYTDFDAMRGMSEAIKPDESVKKALAALDTLATVWAAGFDLRGAVRAMRALPDGEDRLIAFVKQAWCEGAYEGRTSHATSSDKTEDRKDAERYRWIKSTAYQKCYPPGAPDCPFYFHGIGWCRVDRLDAAIDAAMKESKHGN